MDVCVSEEGAAERRVFGAGFSFFRDGEGAFRGLRRLVIVGDRFDWHEREQRHDCESRSADACSGDEFHEVRRAYAIFKIDEPLLPRCLG